jgi:hypothetical protein
MRSDFAPIGIAGNEPSVLNEAAADFTARRRSHFSTPNRSVLARRGTLGAGSPLVQGLVHLLRQ